MNEEFKEKIRKDERERILEALRELGIVNYSIPEEFWFVNINGAVLNLNKWIESREKAKSSRSDS